MHRLRRRRRVAGGAARHTRAGYGDLAVGDLADAKAEHKRSDFMSLRVFDLEKPDVLKALVDCYKYWIALTDCDGFRLDTLRHVPPAPGRRFCRGIKEFAASIGKPNFLLVAEWPAATTRRSGTSP